MYMALRLRRGTDAERQLITPVEGELIYTTDTKLLYVGDGTTVGGTLVTGAGGSGSTTLDALTDTDLTGASVNDVLTYNDITSTWEAAAIPVAELINDTTPQLAGDLDLNGNDITGFGNIDISGSIDLTGDLTALDLTAEQFTTSFVGTNGKSYIQIDTTTQTLAAGSAITFNTANSSIETPQAVSPGNTTTNFVFRAYDGFKYSRSAGIRTLITGTVSENIVPTTVNFYSQNSSGDFNAWFLTHTGDFVCPGAVRAPVFDGDLSGSVYADDSTLLVDGVNGTIPGYVSIASLQAALQDGAGDYAAFKSYILGL